MNKQKFIINLIKKTNRSENECIKINNILENHFIIGKRNKNKIKNDFKEQLLLSEEESDGLYNLCIKTIIKSIFKEQKGGRKARPYSVQLLSIKSIFSMQ